MSQAVQQDDSRYSVDALRARWNAAKREGDLAAILAALYAHEINVGLQSFWDGGWDVWIGDEMNGKRCETTFMDRDMGVSTDIPAWLVEQAERIYPALTGGL